MAETVLVVDDDAAVRDAIADAVAFEGYTVLTAADGQEALQLLACAPRPCVALVDLIMPRLDGWELMQAILAAPALRDIFVLCTTAGRAEPPPGCQALLRKPFDQHALSEALRGAFRQLM